MLGGSLAPPLATIIGLVRSVCRHRHLPGDGPHEAQQFAGHGRHHLFAQLASLLHPVEAPAQPPLRFFGDGFQKSKLIDGERFWRVPVMDGEFFCPPFLSSSSLHFCL